MLPTAPAAEMAKLMVDRIVEDLPFPSGDRVTVLMSGLGATPLMELYLLYGHVDALLRAAASRRARRLVGNYFTSLEMNGVSLTLMRMDAELERLMAAPCASIGLTLHGGLVMDATVDLKAAGPIVLDLVAAMQSARRIA